MDYTQKWDNGFCLENATMFQIQDMFEIGKPNIALKTVKRFKRTPIVISICAHFYHSVLEMGQVLVLELMSPASCRVVCPIHNTTLECCARFTTLL